MTHPAALLVLDSVTRLGPADRGAVAIAASHGGVYAAYLAAKAGVRAVILNDAGIGRERAGVAGLAYLDRLGLPAAAVSHRSCRIGHGADTAAHGVISVVNAAAAALGVAAGTSAQAAAERLAEVAPPWHGAPPAEAETRSIALPDGADGPAVILLDSISLVEPGDVGRIIVTGSHGGLLGDDPRTACKVDVFAALYNDADGGLDDAGTTRLPALDARGIAAATVSAWSARIGDGRSSYEDGVVSHLNDTARRHGADIGISARDLVAMLRAAAKKDRS